MRMGQRKWASRVNGARLGRLQLGANRLRLALQNRLSAQHLCRDRRGRRRDNEQLGPASRKGPLNDPSPSGKERCSDHDAHLFLSRQERSNVNPANMRTDTQRCW